MGHSCCSGSHSHDETTGSDHIQNAACCQAAAAQSEESSSTQAPQGGALRHSWQIQGMDCPSCARKIETAVGRLDGVQQARVLFATGRLEVDAHPTLSAQQIMAAVSTVGFSLAPSHTPVPPDSPTRAHWLGENLPLVILATLMGLASLIGLLAPTQGQWLFTLATLWGLWPIARKAWRLARSGTPFAIETLMTVAAAGALYLGETAEAAMVLLLFMVGEKLEAHAAGRARAGVTALLALMPERAVRICGEQRTQLTPSELRPGDLIEVAPGGRLPADAILLDKSASFDESALTGESIPVLRQVGERIAAGALCVDRVLRLRVVSAPGQNAIDRLLHLIEQAESSRAPITRLIDRFSRWYTPAMMLVALTVALLPPLLLNGDPDVWLYRGLALLLIGCPCALVISTPAAITSALAAAARQGALIKGGAALEQLASLDLIAFDKTGTLTRGKPTVTDLIGLDKGDHPTSLLAMAAAIEQGSHHPLAQAVLAHADSQGISLPPASEVRALPGIGVEGMINGKQWSLLAPQHQAGLCADTRAQILTLEQQGKTVMVLANEGAPKALLALRDQLREEAAAILTELRGLGLDSLMLTGDNPRAAAAIAKDLGIDYRAGLLPADKVALIAELGKRRTIAMVGDGINDAPAMKRAHIGIAMGSGTDVAMESADAALTGSQLHGLPAMIRLARATLANIRQNIGLALGLKAILLVTSLLGLTGLWLAVLADTGATALVTANALRLLKARR